MTSATSKNGTNGSAPDATAANGNGHPKDIPAIGDSGILWDTLPPAVIEKLSQPLDPGLVSQRKGRANRTFNYIEGRTAIDQANRIFGRGGWGYEVVGEVALREIESIDSKSGEVKRERAYVATVRVNATGAPSRGDVGFQAVAEETADGHDTAYKGAVTDGLKRALRSFGDQFGNSLNGDGAATDALTPTLRRILLDLGITQGFEEKQVRAAVKSRTDKKLEDLPATEVASLVEAAVKKLQQAGADSEAKQDDTGGEAEQPE